MEDREAEAALANAILGMDDLRDICHTWLDKIIEELKDKQKLACSAQVILDTEGPTQVGMMLGLSFMPIVEGLPVIEAIMPEKAGVVH